MKKGVLKRMNTAIDRIATHYEYGHFMAETAPDEFFEMVANDLDRFYKTRIMICRVCGLMLEQEFVELKNGADKQ